MQIKITTKSPTAGEWAYVHMAGRTAPGDDETRRSLLDCFESFFGTFMNATVRAEFVKPQPEMCRPEPQATTPDPAAARLFSDDAKKREAIDEAFKSHVESQDFYLGLPLTEECRDTIKAALSKRTRERLHEIAGCEEVPF